MRLTELLLELNFNKNNIRTVALQSNISCGFEAEIVWPVEDFESLDMDELDWNRLQDYIIDQAGERAIDDVRQKYNEWAIDDAYNTVYEANIRDIVEENVDTTHYQDFAEENESDFEAYCEDEGATFDLTDEYTIKDWISETNIESDFIEFARDKLEDDGTISDAIFRIIEDEYDIDYWLTNVVDVQDMLYSADIYIQDFDEEQYLEQAAEEIGEIIQNSSKFPNYTYGGYHATNADDTTIWRIETDSSIDGGHHEHFVGVEIISPVFSSAEEMLEEMSMLYSSLPNDIETNDSTGLHVTMSMPKETDQEPNKLKMALLLGEKYLLDQFSRLGNSYTIPHGDRILGELRSKDPSEISNMKFDKLEAMVDKVMDSAKYRTIHFKGDTNDAGNELFEFRVAGGEDYDSDMSRVKETVIRYATIMRAGYSSLHDEDYAKALYRLVDKITKPAKAVVKDDPILKAFVALGNPSVALAIKQHYEQAKKLKDEGQELEASNSLYDMVDVALNGVDPEKFKGGVNPGLTRGVLMAFKQFGGTPQDYLDRRPRGLKEYYILDRVLRRNKTAHVDTFVENPHRVALVLTNRALEQLSKGEVPKMNELRATHQSAHYEWEQLTKFREYTPGEKTEQHKKELTDKIDVDYDYEQSGDPNKWVVIDGSRLTSKHRLALFKAGILTYD